MKIKILLVLFLLPVVLTGYCTTWQVTNNSFTFSPATLTIQAGDNVTFTLASIHNVVEVSQSDWDANNNTSNGGFSLDFGGGTIPASQLEVGTHYYVCQPHASLGMKGKIIVENNTAITENKMSVAVSIIPNPASNFIQVTLNTNNLIGSEFILIDQLGRKIIKGTLISKTSKIDINWLVQGVYFLQVGDLSKNTFKFMIQK